MKIIIGVVIVLFLFVFIPLHGIHWSTGYGEQTGYVSAVEKTGLIWKTGRAYIKPTLESTQEDVYCVIDEEVFTQLKIASTNKENITVEHFSWLAAGITNCEGEGVIIKSVLPTL